jgi:hypothetical protein
MGVRIEVERKGGFEKLMNLVGDPAQIQRAMSRGLNEHIRAQERQATNIVGAQTGLGAGRVRRVTTAIPSTPGAVMQALVRVNDKAIPAGAETRRSWNRSMAGAVHGDWPTYTRKGGLMAGTFMAKGAIYARTSKKRGPLKKIWGPVLPNELLRKDMPAYPAAERLVNADLERRVMRAVMFEFGL